MSVRMADNGDPEAQQQAAAAQAVMETSAFSNYLRKVVPVLLEDVDDTPAALVGALKERAAIEAMKKFISDPQVPALLIQRMATKGNSSLIKCFLYSQNGGSSIAKFDSCQI